MERGNNGLKIASGTLVALAELHVALGLDIYSNADSRQDRLSVTRSTLRAQPPPLPVTAAMRACDLSA